VAFILDCSTGETALESLAIGFDCSIEQIKSVLLSINIEDIFEKHFETIEVSSSVYLYQYVIEKLGKHKPLTEVIWFHGTRTLKSNNLSDGIFPLNNALDIVWDSLLSSAPDETVRKNLKELASAGSFDHLYDLRTKNKIHWGPYGILVRDVAFNTKSLRQHDYLGMPELVEDILKGYQKTFGISLSTYYSEVLVPKLVKFKCTSSVHDGCVETAIGYLYTYVKGAEICGLAVRCIDKKGSPIKKEDIIEVELV
jgi:hypothetical protein